MQERVCACVCVRVCVYQPQALCVFWYLCVVRGCMCVCALCTWQIVPAVKVFWSVDILFALCLFHKQIRASQNINIYICIYVYVCIYMYVYIHVLYRYKYVHIRISQNADVHSDIRTGSLHIRTTDMLQLEWGTTVYLSIARIADQQCARDKRAVLKRELYCVVIHI